MKVWESSMEIMRYCEIVPEVVGTKAELVQIGMPVESSAPGTPEPRCKTVGYTPLEWLSHWKQALGIILHIPAEEYRTEWMRLVKKHLKESA